MCLCTDAASAMIWWKGGMGAILKQWCNLFLLHIHCCAHKHVLATEYDVSKPLPAYVEMVMTLIMAYFSKSRDRRSELNELQTELGVKNMNLVTFCCCCEEISSGENLTQLPAIARTVGQTYVTIRC